MLNTKLILIEGLPGSGKSTTTLHLGSVLQRYGVPCDFFREEDDPHPISCLDFPINGLTQKMVHLWMEFVRRAETQPTITIIESRLWHNTAQFMLMSEVDVEEIIDFNRQVGQTLSPLSPALIYLDQTDVAVALRRMASTRGEEWVQSALRETLGYPWFTSRGIRDFDGWMSFFEEWHTVAERLFNDWPYPRIKVLDPHSDWAGAHEKINSFLQVDYNLNSVE
jgi:thymidylate kinase